MVINCKLLELHLWSFLQRQIISISTHSNCSLLDCDTMKCCRLKLTFWRYILPLGWRYWVQVDTGVIQVRGYTGELQVMWSIRTTRRGRGMGIEPSLHQDLWQWKAETPACTSALLRQPKVRNVNKMLRMKITYSWSFSRLLDSISHPVFHGKL